EGADGTQRAQREVPGEGRIPRQGRGRNWLAGRELRSARPVGVPTALIRTLQAVRLDGFAIAAAAAAGNTSHVTPCPTESAENHKSFAARGWRKGRRGPRDARSPMISPAYHPSVRDGPESTTSTAGG